MWAKSGGRRFSFTRCRNSDQRFNLWLLDGRNRATFLGSINQVDLVWDKLPSSQGNGKHTCGVWGYISCWNNLMINNLSTVEAVMAVECKWSIQKLQESFVVISILAEARSVLKGIKRLIKDGRSKNWMVILCVGVYKFIVGGNKGVV